MAAEPITQERLNDAFHFAMDACKVSDDLHVLAATEKIRELFPVAVSWTREFQGYDDMPGGDWYVVGVVDAGGKRLDSSYEGDEMEPVNNLLAGILNDWGDHGETREHPLAPLP